MQNISLENHSYVYVRWGRKGKKGEARMERERERMLEEESEICEYKHFVN